MTKYDFPHGFALSEAALYSFTCQDVYPDVISFAAAIPDHLKSLFLIPVQLQFASGPIKEIAQRVASVRYAYSVDEMVGTKTFVQDDLPADSNEPPSEGSIFDYEFIGDRSKHQEQNYDSNDYPLRTVNYNSDVDLTESGLGYPYRLDYKPTHSSSIQRALVFKLRVALQPDKLKNHTPYKIQQNAKSISVSLVSYDKKTRVFTFSADAGNGPKTVQSKLSELDHVSLSCNCPFWRWNGPEYHAKKNNYMLNGPFGDASAPNVRDPERQYWVCKHAYAVLKRLDDFVQEVIDENWDKDEEEVLAEIDEEWDRLEGAVEVPIDEIEDDDIELEIDWDMDDLEEVDQQQQNPDDSQVQEEEQEDREFEEGVQQQEPEELNDDDLIEDDWDEVDEDDLEEQEEQKEDDKLFCEQVRFVQSLEGVELAHILISLYQGRLRISSRRHRWDAGV